MTIGLSKYDFVDFGCSAGGSMEFVKKNWGKDNGIGIDIAPSKVEKTRALGYNAELADLTKPLSFSGRVPFSILSHVLEHIPSALIASQIIRTAALISSDFVLIGSRGSTVTGRLHRWTSNFTGRTGPRAIPIT